MSRGEWDSFGCETNNRFGTIGTSSRPNWLVTKPSRTYRADQVVTHKSPQEDSVIVVIV
jgi:hypothetical protein